MSYTVIYYYTVFLGLQLPCIKSVYQHAVIFYMLHQERIRGRSVQLRFIENQTAPPLRRVRNEKIDINEINWTSNQYIGYLNLYIKTAKRAAPNP